MTVPSQDVKQRFWLLKSEPSCFSFADLQARPGNVEHWDGLPEGDDGAEIDASFRSCYFFI